MNQKFKRSRQILVAIVLTASVIGLSSCEKYTFSPPTVDPVDTVHFQTDIQPIFTANCITCHSTIVSPDLRPGNSYLALTSGHYVDPPAETSRLYSHMISAGHTAKSSAVDKQKVLIWITQGALNN